MADDKPAINLIFKEDKKAFELGCGLFRAHGAAST